MSVKSTLGQNCKMFVSMRKKTAGIKLQNVCQYEDKKTKNKE
jgi:hypothetical protein